MIPKITFEQIFERHEWKPIRNCPGRFTLVGGANKLNLEEITGARIDVYKFTSAKVLDEISIVKFTDGGLISYHKAHDEFLHTLNTEEGFYRKLEHLEINLPDEF